MKSHPTDVADSCMPASVQTSDSGQEVILAINEILQHKYE